jgi:hypothetical protein
VAGKTVPLIGALGLLMLTAGASADTPAIKYGYYCASKHGDDLARCRRCVDEALDPSRSACLRHARQSAGRCPRAGKVLDVHGST